MSRTFQERYYLGTGGPGRRLWRDLRLLAYVAALGWRWLIVGGRVRRAYRRALRTGRPWYIDHLAERD